MIDSIFDASRLNASTFLIVERDDVFDENPYMYAKICTSSTITPGSTAAGRGTLLLIDTGCGGKTRRPGTSGLVTALRVFLETVHVDANGGEPLNPGGRMEYVVVLTHCHYDHILAVEQFASSRVVASGHAPAFIARDALPAHSLCAALGLRTPEYAPELAPHLGAVHPSVRDVRVVHTPGHTPDSIAVWDAGARALYMGDTLYEREPIIFPNEGSVVEWWRSTGMLVEMITTEAGAVLCAGHCTAGVPALDALEGARAFVRRVVRGAEVVRRRFEKRGEVCVEYGVEGERWRLVCPERLVREAREAGIAG